MGCKTDRKGKDPMAAKERRPLIRILLVDDDPLICRLGQALLENLGYQVEVAQEGREALRLYRKRKRPDLVILDYHLPGDNGSHVLEKIKNLDPEARVVLASGFLPPQEVSHLKEKGASGLIYKPFRMQELETRIRQVLAGQSGF